jgi:hypothetical protein
MIGRNPGQPLQVYGDGGAPVLAPIVRESAEKLGLEVRLHGTRSMSASDHSPFEEAGIPYLALFTGLHDDYHQVDDEAEALDYQQMEKVVSLAFEVSSRVAGLEEAPGSLPRVGRLGRSFEVVRPGPGERPPHRGKFLHIPV